MILMMNPFYLCLIPLLSSCIASSTELGIKFEKGSGIPPTLTLPYGTWQARNYTASGDIFVFKNIRFGAPPVGDLRWAKPAPPLKETTIQNGSYGPSCIQLPVQNYRTLIPQLSESTNSTVANPPSSNGSFSASVQQSEDCLFLDLYVPAKAIQNQSLRLPVISWIYGGGYVNGAKDLLTPLSPFYDGRGAIEASGGNVIFISSNYRLGAYGFLAGTTMEKEGLPNVGLYDQRAVFQWIQDYISLVGGDKKQVSAWGESAGGGSILHHLTAFGGTQDPLFSRAILQSPGLAFAFDRKGSLEQVFQTFAKSAGCAGKGVACLRAASAEALEAANKKGIYGLNPSADGGYVRQLAILELAKGNYWKHLDSIIISHVLDEPENFTPATIQTDEDFDFFISSIIPTNVQSAGIKSQIAARYPPAHKDGGVFSTERQRFKALFGDVIFLCNIRALTDAYIGKNFNLQYSTAPYTHGADVAATFDFPGFDLGVIKDVFPVLIPSFEAFSQTYQSYLVSHARTGNPNTYRESHGGFDAVYWPRPDNRGDALRRVLNTTDTGFEIVTDEETRKSTCRFWEGIAQEVTELGGYVPP